MRRSEKLCSLLILEDDPVISEKIKSELEVFTEQTNIIMSETVEESLKLLEDYIFKIAILDLNLTDGSGIKVLNKIQEKELETTVFIFSVDLEMKKICIKKGATAFFDKSKGLNKLITTVQSALEK